MQKIKERMVVVWNDDGSFRGASLDERFVYEDGSTRNAQRPLTEEDADALLGTVDAAVIAQLDAAKAKADDYDALKADRDKIAAELDALKNPPKAESITPRQAKLALYGAGLLDDVERMVAEADKTVQVHYAESVVWYRSDPVLNGLAAQLGMTSEQLDDLFLQASKL